MSDISPEQFSDASLIPPVRGFLHRPNNSNGRGIVLTHGAGANCQTELLRGLAEAFAGAGFVVLRVNLPFRQERAFGPPRHGEAETDRQGLSNAVEALRKLLAKPLFLAGHSYGGRQATMLCASNPHLVAALLLLSYPLHPPRKPTQLRTQHFPSLQTPALFVHGSRDEFGSISEVEAARKLIPGKTQLLPIEGTGHDLRTKAGDISGRVLAAFQEFIGG
jgi:predicted alpha/beta-hydrolase family hydrolase